MFRKITFANIFFIFILIGFVLGFMVGISFKKDQPVKITTVTQTQTQTAQKTQIQSQATVQKDSTMMQQMNYTEKFFNKKGILMKELDYGNNMLVTAQSDSSQHFNEVNDIRSRSQIVVTTTETYMSRWWVGMNVRTQDILTPYILTKQPRDVNLIVEFRPWDQFYLFAETNYKFDSQIGFLIPL